MYILMPSHQLYGCKITSMPKYEHYTDGDITTVQSDQTTLTNRARTHSQIISQFLKCWRSEYRLGLRDREMNAPVWEMLYIREEGPRIRWNQPVVEELITGRDGSVRDVRVKTKHGLTTFFF